MSDDNVVDIRELLEKRKENRNTVIFIADENPDGLDPVRWARDFIEAVARSLDTGEGYNRAREIDAGRHEAAMAMFEEHAEYLDVFIQNHGEANEDD